MSCPSSCPMCGGRAREALSAYDRNRRTTDERFRYRRCESCRTIFIAEPPDDMSRYYAGDYHGFGPGGEPLWTSNATLRRAERARAGLLLRHVQRGRLIDIGAGAGAFSACAKQAGFNVTAIEMDQRCCAYLETRLDVPAVCTDKPVDALRALAPAVAITLWHVLEHLANPSEMLHAVSDQLEPGGVLAIGVPNPESMQFRALRGRWVHFDAPRHVCLAPAGALISAASAAGLRCAYVTTNDPFGLVCNAHGWATALRRDPANGPMPFAITCLGQALSLALAPVERRGLRGSALTALFVKR